MTRPFIAVWTAGSVAVRGQRAGQGRPDELRFFLGERLQQPRRHARLGVVLEIRVGDGAQTIVRIVERRAHHVARSRIVEPGQQHQRAKANVAVRMTCGGFHQRGDGLGRRRAADGTRRGRTGGRVELAEVVDGGLELDGGDDRLRLSAGLRRRRRRQGQHARDDESDHSTAFSASCRYACSSRGNAIG